MADNSKISISLPTDLLNLLKAESARTGKNISAVVREMLVKSFNSKMISDASSLQRPLEEKVNNLVDDQKYLANMIEAVYRNVAYLSMLGNLPAEVESNGRIQTVSYKEDVRNIARKKSIDNYRKAKSSSLSLGEYLEDYLIDPDFEEEAPTSEIPRDELRELVTHIASEQAKDNFVETPKELKQQFEQQDSEVKVPQPKPTRQLTQAEILAQQFGYKPKNY